MKNMFKLKHLLLLAALFPFVLLNIGSAIAAKGGVPNGKPFQAIQSQILSIETGVEDLQAQIDQLVTDTTNLAERIAINEEFIAALQNDNLLIIERLEAIEYESQLLG